MPPRDESKTGARSTVKSKVDRRRFLIGSAMAGLGGAAAAAARHDGELGGPSQTFRGAVPWQEGTADAPPGASGSGYIFLTPAEVALVDAAVGRLIPDDPVGPGAVEAGVTFSLIGNWPESTGKATIISSVARGPRAHPNKAINPASPPPNCIAPPWRPSTSTPARHSTAPRSVSSRRRIRTRC